MESETIQGIKSRLEDCDIQGLPALIKTYEGDGRAGVQKLLLQSRRKYDKYQAELARLSNISRYERRYYEKGCTLIAGADEVGRGPLAGPVVAGAVILPVGFTAAGINDSKKLSPGKREELDVIIRENALGVGIGVVDVKTIDEINILNATKRAMAEAVKNLGRQPEILLIDAIRLPDVKIPQESIVKGDEKSISIAAASIVAKVYRDRMMTEYAGLFPEYGFDSNKGYGAPRHVEALRLYGPCPIHRRSFLNNILGDHYG